jgi:hypothetical protein
MKLQVPALITKLIPLRPRLVCFVGKKIWDIFGGVCEKTAGEAVEGGMVVKKEKGAVEEKEEEVEREEKEEEGVDRELDEEGVKLEREVTPIDTVNISGKGKGSMSTRKKKKVIVPFDCHKPRPLRLPLGDGLGYVYFWATPNTSGLERTPVRPK